MSKQASKSTNTTTIRAPQRFGLCMQAWAHFASKPTVSKDLPALAEQGGYNLTNLRIELSRYNRFVKQGGKFAA
jgi:hypothetical protein